MRYFWLFHPEAPGDRVLVVRGFWARLFRPKHFATLDEVEAYRIYQAGLKASEDRRRRTVS